MFSQDFSSGLEFDFTSRPVCVEQFSIAFFDAMLPCHFPSRTIRVLSIEIIE